MFISDKESRMQRKQEQDCAGAEQIRAMQSDHRQCIWGLDGKQKARHRAQLKGDVPRYVVCKASCSLLPACVAGHQQPYDMETEMQSVQDIIISVREIMVSVLWFSVH